MVRGSEDPAAPTPALGALVYGCSFVGIFLDLSEPLEGQDVLSLFATGARHFVPRDE